MKPSVFYLSVCLLVTRTGLGQAAEPSTEALASARELFAEATALEGRSDWVSAMVKLKRALLIKETPGLRYHLAYCEEQLGSLVLAAEDYERASKLIADGASAPDVEPLLVLAERRLDSRLAKLELVVPSGIVATAELDGRELPRSALGTSVRMDPGAHRILVRAAGRRDFRGEVSLKTGEHRTLKVFFGDDNVAPTPAAPPAAAPAPKAQGATGAPTSSPKRVRTAPPRASRGIGTRGFVMIGEGVVALVGIGVGVGYAVAGQRATAHVARAQRAVEETSPGNEGACNEPKTAACRDLDQALGEHRRALAFETVGFVGAGVAAGALALTWAFWPTSSNALAVELHPREQGALLRAGGAF